MTKALLPSHLRLSHLLLQFIQSEVSIKASFSSATESVGSSKGLCIDMNLEGQSYDSDRNKLANYDSYHNIKASMGSFRSSRAADINQLESFI